jgi:branched-chain amino acid transport system substrate-binding protein
VLDRGARSRLGKRARAGAGRDPAIISVTGPSAAVGASEAQTLGVFESLVNTSGGIKGRPVKFALADDGSVAQTTVSLFTQAVARKPPAIIGPISSSTCSATAPLVAKTGPVMYCMSPGIHPEQGSYVFSASVSRTELAHEHFNPTDISVTAQTQHVRASGAQALLTWSSGSPFGTLLCGIRDAGLTIPVGATDGTMSYPQLTQFKDSLPKDLYFPGPRGF